MPTRETCLTGTLPDGRRVRYRITTTKRRTRGGGNLISYVNEEISDGAFWMTSYMMFANRRTMDVAVGSWGIDLGTPIPCARATANRMRAAHGLAVSAATQPIIDRMDHLDVTAGEAT